MKLWTKRLLATMLVMALLVACGISGLVLPTSAAAGDTPFVADFESGTLPTKIKSWTSAFGATIGEDPTDPTNHVYKMVKSANNSTQGTAWGFGKNKRYELTFRVYISGSSGKVSMRTNAGSKKIYGTTAQVTETGKWVERTILIWCPSDRTNDGYTMYLTVSGASESTPIYIDDIVLREVSDHDGNMVLGGDFEAENYYLNDGVSGPWWDFLRAANGFSVVEEEGSDGNHCLYLPQKTSTSTKVAAYYKAAFGLKNNRAYELRMRVKGGAISLYLNSAKGFVTNTGWTKWNTAGSEEWKEIVIPFVMSGSKFNDDGNGLALGLDTAHTSTGVYIDDVRLYDVGSSAATGTVKNGTIHVKTDAVPTTKCVGVAADAGEIVTATITPSSGYMMVPGSLTYTGVTSKTEVKILNESLTDNGFGGTKGNTYQFKMPNESVTVTAQFVSTAEQTFAMDTLGTSLRKKADGSFDGIRFLTRMNLATAFDAESETLSVLYGGAEYEIVELGSLLKRYEEGVELTDENDLWKAVAYTKGEAMKLVDYTESYIDFTSVMMTTYTDRTYTARGYVVLRPAVGGEDVVLYSATQLSDSIASAQARL